MVVQKGRYGIRKHPLILVVDDDTVLLKTVHDTLVGEGFHVITASDAIAALFLVAKRNPDLVLLDIMMPHYDGFQALEMIRLHSNVPVIMLTCLTDQKSLSRTLGDGGADDYITKPFRSGVLVAHIRAKLRRAASTRQRLVGAPAHGEEDIDNDKHQS